MLPQHGLPVRMHACVRSRLVSESTKQWLRTAATKVAKVEAEAEVEASFLAPSSTILQCSAGFCLGPRQDRASAGLQARKPALGELFKPSLIGRRRPTSKPTSFEPLHTTSRCLGVSKNQMLFCWATVIVFCRFLLVWSILGSPR